MTLIDRILEGTNVFEAIEDDFESVIDQSELRDIQEKANAVLADAGAQNYFNVVAKPYGTGFKLLIKRNDNGLINLENGLDTEFVNSLGWEKLDTDVLNDGTIVSYYR